MGASLNFKEKLIWMGGFFEGEGSIMIEHRHSNRVPKPFFRKMRLSVSQMFIEPLLLFKDTFGGSLTYHHSGMWCWVVADVTGIRVLNLLKPYLFKKGEEADLALMHQYTLRSIPGSGSGKYFSDFDIAELNSFGEAFKEYRKDRKGI